MYGLCLNMMRDRAERVDLVATAATPEALCAFMDQHKVEEYSDGSTSAFSGTLRKTFAAGSPLEYYNPPFSIEVDNPGVFGDGIISIMSREDAIQRAAENWDNEVASKRID